MTVDLGTVDIPRGRWHLGNGRRIESVPQPHHRLSFGIETPPPNDALIPPYLWVKVCFNDQGHIESVHVDDRLIIERETWIESVPATSIPGIEYSRWWIVRWLRTRLR